jgi:CheY-like chemotaxis protein
MKKILLVDDDDIFNFLHTRILQLSGIALEIDTVSNGKLALDFLNESYALKKPLPDAILLDLKMPEMDGFAFLSSLKKLSIPGLNNVKVIVITSSVDLKDIQKAKKMGIRDYLIKPITPEKLKEALRI